MTPFVELHCHSNHSFLDGGSHPWELVQRAAELEMPALAITDYGGVYGAVKFIQAAKKLGVKPLVGCELEILDPGEKAGRASGSRRRRRAEPGPDHRPEAGSGLPTIRLIARDPRGYSNLCRLISAAHRDQPKGLARADWEMMSAHRQGLFFLTSESRPDHLARLRDIAGRENLLVELTDHLRPEDRWLNHLRAERAAELRLQTVATNQVHYHVPERRRLHDVLTAIRHHTTLEQARGLLHPNAERHLKGGEEIRRLLPGHPEALAATWEIAQACKLDDLDFRNTRFPGYPVPPGETPFSYLYQLCQAGARQRYHPITPEVGARLQRELEVIDRTGLAEFFLINWDLMRFAREHGVPGQGRGSAADSIVAYVLGITRVDPIEHNLLFERFLHEEMTSTPDIDIDFSSEHREAVIRYVYEKYGWERTGMVCNLVTFRPRMAVRELGRAMGFAPEVIDRLSRSIDRWFGHEEGLQNLAEEIAATGGGWREFAELCGQVQGFPRHLSIHVGGMLVTGRPLIDMIPVEPATMPGRVVVQFDKYGVEDLGLIKMDLLGLRTLSVIAETLDLVEAGGGVRPDLDRLDLREPAVYQMCQAADTIGVFQIESRAQMQTLPRTRPAEFNDLVVEVAIIRPGPIQGNAVHPYIRRRQGIEKVTFAHPRLEPILADTMGVILYQEQILEIAMQVAGMRPAEADRFRRAMTRELPTGELERLESDFIGGCLANGVPRQVASELFDATRGFAVYGFCHSHAAAFARTSYETAWLKLHHPAAFYCGLLNHQPMGFYHPSVLVEDAKRHGVPVLPLDINRSRARCQPESVAGGLGLRIGFNYLRGLGTPGAEAITAERERGGDYRGLDDFAERLRGAPIGPEAVRNLIMVGAFDELGSPRREILWQWHEHRGGRGQRVKDPGQADLRLPTPAPRLPEVTGVERTRLEYRIVDVTTGPHLMSYWREWLRKNHWLSSGELASIADGRPARTAGVVITRQAPGTARRIRFFTLEDEFGHINLVIKPGVFARHRKVANLSHALLVEGTMQRRDGVWSILVETMAPVPALEAGGGISHNYR